MGIQVITHQAINLCHVIHDPSFTRYIPDVPVYAMMVPTANTERYSFLLETNLGTGRPTFLAGATGSGKTMLAAQVSPNVQAFRIRSMSSSTTDAFVAA